jgi:hypothetical protein
MVPCKLLRGDQSKTADFPPWWNLLDLHCALPDGSLRIVARGEKKAGEGRDRTIVDMLDFVIV